MNQPVNYSLLPEDFLLKFGKPSDTVAEVQSKPLIYLPFGVVKMELPSLLMAEKFREAVAVVMGEALTEHQLETATENEVAAFCLWLKQQLEAIQQREENYLSSEPDADQMAAGVYELNQFGPLVTVDRLAGGDLLKYEAIEKMPYWQVYQKLKLDKVNSDIEKRLRDIVEARARRR